MRDGSECGRAGIHPVRAPGKTVMAKAVADVDKIEKGEGGETRAPAWLAGGLGWGPRKFRELKAFFAEVKSELKKVTWPSRKEVYATTIVVIVTTLFFGFYLWLLDLGFTVLFEQTVGKL
jgi:preprotein translocase subunit SecE